MSNVYVITRPEGYAHLQDCLFCCLIRDDRLMEVHVVPQKDSLLGNIYVGKVKNVIKNIEAAFVEIAGGKICFLPFSEAARPILTNRIYDGRLLAGDEVLVQVKKDAVKTKDPVLTARLSFAGRYVSVSLGEGNGVRYSHKLSEQGKAFAKEALKEVTVYDGMTLVVRTESERLINSDRERGAALLAKEAQSLLLGAQKLCNAGKTRTAFSLLSEDIPAYIRHLENAKDFMPDRIVTDCLDVYNALKGWRDREEENCRYPEPAFYQDNKIGLYQLYGLRAMLDEALSRTIWLKSGGYLVIEPTEALTVIDVNSGKYAGKKGAEETFFLVNREAAAEVARQLRLRSLSGIILVDFINLSSGKKQQELLSFLKEETKNDPAGVHIVDMTKLGLVEITRKKTEASLAEQMKEKGRLGREQ